jgi:hypothetical protein
MSQGGGPKDEATSSAIADARAKGTLVIVADGNDPGAPVSAIWLNILLLSQHAQSLKRTAVKIGGGIEVKLQRPTGVNSGDNR